MSDCVNVWMCECVSANIRLCEYMHVGMSDCRNVGISEHLDAWMCDSVNVWDVYVWVWSFARPCEWSMPGLGIVQEHVWRAEISARCRRSAEEVEGCGGVLLAMFGVGEAPAAHRCCPPAAREAAREVERLQSVTSQVTTGSKRTPSMDSVVPYPVEAPVATAARTGATGADADAEDSGWASCRCASTLKTCVGFSHADAMPGR